MVSNITNIIRILRIEKKFIADIKKSKYMKNTNSLRPSGISFQPGMNQFIMKGIMQVIILVIMKVIMNVII